MFEHVGASGQRKRLFTSVDGVPPTVTRHVHPGQMIVVNELVFPKEGCCPAYQEGYECLCALTLLVEPEFIRVTVRSIRQPGTRLFRWPLTRAHKLEQGIKAYRRPRKSARATAFLPVDRLDFWPRMHVQPQEIEPVGDFGFFPERQSLIPPERYLRIRSISPHRPARKTS